MSVISRLTFSSSHSHRFPLSVYLIADWARFQNKELFFSKVTAAVKGGVSCVQFRDHESDFSATLRTALRLKSILQETPLFINTLEPFKLVHSVGAAGAYLEGPFSPSEARKELGEKAVIGIRVTTEGEVLAANQTTNVDYLSLKIASSTHACPKNDHFWDLPRLRWAVRNTNKQIVVLGSLHKKSVRAVFSELSLERGDGAGFRGGIMDEEDPYATVQEILAIWKRERA